MAAELAAITWALQLQESPMGQQVYESRLTEELIAQAAQRHDFQCETFGSLRSHGTPTRRVPMKLLNRLPLSLARAVGRLTIPSSDLVHRLDLRVPPSGALEIVTIHDLPPLRFDDEGGMPRWSIASLRGGRGVICPSSFAESEVRELTGAEFVWVIPNGVDESFFVAEPMNGPELRRIGITGQFLLHLGGATKRKNLAALAEAWRVVSAHHADVQLVLCGPEDRRRTDAFRSVPGAVLVGRVNRLDASRLLRAATAAVVPSLYEGFGLPALEAMAAGAPVIAANRGALPEVCGDAALLVEPDAVSLAAGMRAILENEPVRGRLSVQGRERAAKFTWESCARRHLAVYEEVLSQP